MKVKEMEFFVNSIICFIIAVFPTLLSTLYIIYTRSLKRKERSLCTDIAVIFTQYILDLPITERSLHTRLPEYMHLAPART